MEPPALVQPPFDLAFKVHVEPLSMDADIERAFSVVPDLVVEPGAGLDPAGAWGTFVDARDRFLDWEEESGGEPSFGGEEGEPDPDHLAGLAAALREDGTTAPYDLRPEPEAAGLEPPQEARVLDGETGEETTVPAAAVPSGFGAGAGLGGLGGRAGEARRRVWRDAAGESAGPYCALSSIQRPMSSMLLFSDVQARENMESSPRPRSRSL